MTYNMVINWRRETDHIAPDALSCLRRKGPRESGIDTARRSREKDPKDPCGRAFFQSLVILMEVQHANILGRGAGGALHEVIGLQEIVCH